MWEYVSQCWLNNESFWSFLYGLRFTDTSFVHRYTDLLAVYLLKLYTKSCSTPRLCLLYNIYNWYTVLCNHHCTRLLEADLWGIYLEYLYVLYCDLPSAFPPSSSHSIFVSTNFFYMDIIINYMNNKSSII